MTSNTTQMLHRKKNFDDKQSSLIYIKNVSLKVGINIVMLVSFFARYTQFLIMNFHVKQQQQPKKKKKEVYWEKVKNGHVLHMFEIKEY